MVAPEVRDGRVAPRVARLSLRGLSAPGRPLARTRHQGRAAVDGALPRAHPRDRPDAAVSSSAAARLAGHGRRDHGLPARGGLDPAAPRAGVRVGRPGCVDASSSSASPRRRRTARCACTATVTPATCCGPTQGPHFVDLDDCMTGPAVQDLWMLLSGRPEEMQAQLDDLLEGYAQFADFDYHEIAADRAAADAADHALRRLARAALGGPGVPARVPVVRGAEVLGAARPRPAGADRRDGIGDILLFRRIDVGTFSFLCTEKGECPLISRSIRNMSNDPRHRRRRLHRQPRRPPARRARRARGGARQSLHRLSQRGARRAARRRRHGRSRGGRAGARGARGRRR